MATTLTDKIVKIRKDRECFSCYRKSSKGSKLRYWCGIYEGNFNSTYSCETCDKIMDFLREGEYPEGFVYEGLEKDQTPEQYLDELISQENKRQDLIRQSEEYRKTILTN